MCFKRKAILMIHGFVGGNHDYGNLHNELEVYKKFDVYTFTLPAHEKMIVKDVEYQEWIDEAENQIKFLINNNYKEIYLIGHSMGGVIAAYLASKYKEVKKLVLAAPSYRYFCFKDGKPSIKGINETLKSMRDLLTISDTELIIERIIKTPISTMLEFTKLVSTYQNDIERVFCPILTIRGSKDHIVPSESTDYVYNSVKSNCNILVNVKELTHDCFTHKRSDEVKNIVIDFLKKKPKNKKETINI